MNEVLEEAIATPERRRRLLVVAAVAFVVVSIAGVTIGSGSLRDANLRETFVELRLARLAASMVIGAALSVAGVLAQGLFRNPLADSSVLGTTSGAVVGGKLTLVLLELGLGAGTIHGLAPDLLVPIGCVLGAALALLVLVALAREARSVVLLLLVGFSLSSLFASLGSFLTVLAQDSWELGRALVAFAMGSVSGTSLRNVAFALPLVGVGLAVAMRHAESLDLLLSGEDEAASLGLDVGLVRKVASVWIAILTGAAVSIGGFVAFVGLVVPHVLRPYAGVEHRKLLPFAAIFGALFVAASDVVTRLFPFSSELPLGIVTGLLGAPVFVYLLLRSHREGSLHG